MSRPALPGGITEQQIIDEMAVITDGVFSVSIAHADPKRCWIPQPVLEKVQLLGNVSIDDNASPAGFGTPPRALNTIKIIGVERDGVVRAATRIIEELDALGCTIIQLEKPE